MNSADLDDTHLCIKCNGKIFGLAKYIDHRKRNCSSVEKPNASSTTTNGTMTRTSPIVSRNHLDHTYDSFHFVEPEPPSNFLQKAAESHDGKSSKSLTEAYDIPYELGADVFFSSLQLQSVSTGCKTVPGGRAEIGRSKEEDWHVPRGDPLLKVLREHDDAVFKPLKFEHESPELSDEEEEDEDPDEFGEEVEEDYDIRRHSPPTVPATHTGGKWRPEHRPQLRHPHMERISPNWDEPGDETYAHPPAEYTKGKWIPGSKHLEYRENHNLTKCEQLDDSFWCNICCRKLKSRANYEQHLKSSFHLKRAETECQLAQATLGTELTLSKQFSIELQRSNKDRSQLRQRRSSRLRCNLCRYSVPRQWIGKHLISHYHYRRLQQQSPGLRQSSLQDILNHMSSIIKQSPFQCMPCRFYANTEATFLSHWQSEKHLELTIRLGGSFWCDYCQFECNSNEAMLEHFLQSTHKSVISSLNRSVPVYIAQRRHIYCSCCGMRFLYNIQLRRHFSSEHPGVTPTGSAADHYQCRFRCQFCRSIHRSRVALQRHEKYKHQFIRYYCTICRLEFESPMEARRHRSLMQHRMKTKPNKSTSQPQQNTERMFSKILEDRSPKPSGDKRCIFQKQCSDCSQTFESPQLLRQHLTQAHPSENHQCLSCGCHFQSAQALGRHTRNCRPTPTTTKQALHKINLWPCDKCSFSSQYKSDLIYHQFYHTQGETIDKNELLQCPLCSKKFRKHSLRAHLRNHTDEKIFQCPECLQKFARHHNLKNHLTSKHGQNHQRKPKYHAKNKELKINPKKYQCETCGKILTKKSSLKAHEMTHNANIERNFHCHFKECAYSGWTHENLKTHLISHSQGSYKCTKEKCIYVGKSAMHLRRHLKSHKNENTHWFSCNQCDFKARLKGHLTRHILQHSGAKPHKCPYCDFHCSTIDNLRKHIIKTGKHPGRFIYECDKCLVDQSNAIFKSNSFKEYQRHLTIHLSK
ncbi:uncharacterized protein Dwil_GK18705 [Drosophila willistoni]|uniref:C2H2-type domain-containing protein n=1 Tax=Drosophila willistoni TaxID=7260 RepID=A0A0Q9X4R1_DROWI|nr:zinc finger protein 184 [Drosophila willistoni]XP_046866579.1 zinc finger protein 184 [Drosophila willistoni]XP_046866580.1 zinc finger protein 184 [Drosophila willistoni]XP_046866581.1 zinc finger protein 184 [Drosophila willistoni]KRF99266.1 uncharacterized protein Dwil_GK18705 [Drosophila willistoni]